MMVESRPADRAGIWATFAESPVAVKIILGGVFVSRLGGFLNIFVVLYLTSKGDSATRAAIALGAYGAGSVVGVLIGGATADRLGARNATVLSMTGAAVLTAGLLYLPTYPLLLLAVALAGLMGQIYRPASATLLSELTPESRQVMIFAMYRFGLNLGAMAAPLIGFALYNADHQRYTLLFWGEALIALTYSLLAWLMLPARVPPSGSASTDPADPAAGYLAVLNDRRYTLYLVAMFLNAALYTQFMSTLPLDISASGLEIFWYTFAISLNGFVVIALELLVTKVSQNRSFRLTTGAATALVGIGMAFYGLPLVPAVVIIGTLIWTMAEVVGAPATFAYPAVASPSHLRGRYIGSFQFVFGLGSAVGPVAGGALFARLGHGVWPVLAIGSAVALVFNLAGVRNRPRGESTVGAGPGPTALEAAEEPTA